MSNVPPFVKVGAIALLPVVGVGGLIYAVTDDPPVLHAEMESSDLPDFTTPEPSTHTPATQPSTPSGEGTESSSPTDTSSPTGDSDNSPDPESSPTDSDTSSDDQSERPVLTLPPTEPDSPEPTSPEPEPTDRPTPTPSSIPTEPGEPTTSPEPTETPEPTPTQPEEPEQPDLPLTDIEMSLVEAAEKARAEAGCQDLRIDSRLTAASRAHSADMRARYYVSNVSPDGETPDDRAADAGYEAPVGENISFPQRNARPVVNSWMGDGEERARLLDCDYTAVGVGVEYGLLGVWWTLLLGED